MRQQGWEKRFAEVIEAARAQPFEWGVSDCWRLACSSVEALTGEDRWPMFAGQYYTKGEALRIIALHACSFEDFAGWFFGARPIDPRFARDGDLMLVRQPGMDALGVCVGSSIAVRLERELGFMPRAAAAKAWEIG